MALRSAVQRWWKQLGQSKPEPAIFWHFIRADRNALVHEYRFTPERSSMLASARAKDRRVATDAPPLSHVFMSTPLGVQAFEEVPTYRMKVGPFTGRDQRDLVDEAIRWWEEQLAAIEAAAAST